MSFYEKTGTKANIVDHRKKWDENEYYIKAQERKAKEQLELDIKNGLKKKEKEPAAKGFLKMREEKIDISSTIGKSLNSDGNADGSIGFHCDICDCTVKDSTSFVTHLNGKSHQKNIGNAMKCEKSTLTGVQERIAKIAAERKAAKSKVEESNDFSDLINEEQIASSSKSKKRKIELVEEEVDEEEDEMAKMMGFGKFGTKKK
uniref:Matrin-type domain-containing protein n=1 Tax=Rhabditophanes sp. KR3021 TaxID=114890 RepID=A0AC35U3F1_9BILA